MPPKKHGAKGGDDEDDESQRVAVDVYSETSEILSVSSAGEGPKLKQRDFEFTSSINMMRVTRLIIVLQVLALCIDSPSVQLPIVWRIVCRGFLHYTGKFYSRPFVDVVYFFEWLGTYTSQIPSNPDNIRFETPSTPSTPDSSGASGSVPARRGLSASDYRIYPDKEASFGAEISFLDERNWHSVKHFSHFFLSALFAIMIALFTIKFWEIKDYTDRREVREWLAKYIADGWWRRGLAVFTWSFAKGAIAMMLFVFFLFAIARQISVNSIPTPVMAGSALAMLLSLCGLAYVLGWLGIRSTEQAFVRYVSQNVSYTSSIILKRVVKAKIDIGIVLMFAIYMPALRSFTEGFMVITDWNDTLTYAHRRSVNFFTPCYLMAFPPYTEPGIPASECSVNYATSPDQPIRAEGFYQDRQIISCDSYLGVAFFTSGMIFFAFMAVGYGWLYYEFINMAATEMKGSRWVHTVTTLLSIKRELELIYAEDFNVVSRLWLDSKDEAHSQFAYIIHGVKFVGESSVWLMIRIIKMIVYPIAGLISPCAFIGYRAFLLICNCEGPAEKSDAQKARDRRIEIEKLRAMGIDMGSMGSSLLNSTQSGGLESLSLLDSLKSLHEDEAEPEEPSFYEKTKEGCLNCLDRLNVIKHGHRAGIEIHKSVKSAIRKSHTVKSMKLGLSQVKSKFFSEKKKGNSLADLGGSKGQWRIALTIKAQHRKIDKINKRITEELRIARGDFVNDHILCITVFDHVVDSSGLFMLISQYHYHRLYWTLVLFMEMTTYSLVSAYTNYYLEWKERLQVIIVINISFGVLTYLGKPFTEDVDRWLDFLGRALVSGTLYGIIFCNELMPKGVNDNVSAGMYTPWDSFSYLTSVEPLDGAFYVLVDCFMTALLFIYTLYILSFVGFFSGINRKLTSLLYAMHDSILDYLISQLERRAIGRENMFEGLLLVQQWDDIVKEQRRYALMTWPDVRPNDLVPFSVKLIQMKWAGFFNLTLGNIRSSLGLSLLHTSMCAADSEVSRWLMHLYPELLNAEDFQRDTPIFVALKESSYFLLKYGEQNEGLLDDETSYQDEEFLSYYPEIDLNREDAANNGEWILEMGEVHHMDAFESRALKLNKVYEDTINIRELREYKPTFKIWKSKLGKFATHDEIEAEKAEKAAFYAVHTPNEANEKDLTPEEAKAKAKAEAKALAKEKASLYRKRFPEDDYQDNFESGQMASWGIIGLSVPDVNLFVDPAFATFRDNKGFNSDSDEEADEEYYDLEKPLDMRYNVKSLRYPEIPDKYANLVPNGHPALLEMQDWDIMRKKKKVHGRTLLQAMHDTKKVMEEVGGALFGGAVTMAQKIEKDRQVRFKMCKFAEIMLSDEIQECAKDIEWNVDIYKELNKIASIEQGRIAQNLAMACNLKPPPGFTRISEWTLGVSTNVFDEFPYEEFNMIVRSAVQIVGVTSKVASVIGAAVPKVSRGARRPGDVLLEHSQKRAGDHPNQTDGFNDRVIHYMAECFVACRKRLNFSDSELSVSGRVGWRAIARALRRNNCTFIMPSMFVGTKQILTTHLDLSRNELDDGDCILIADALLYKQTMQFLDLSYNRVGARGMIRMCKAMKGHEHLKVLYMQHNRIGPAVGREMGVWLKNCQSIEVLDMSHNRMGELIQYPTTIERQKIKSAVRDIMQGVRHNKSLQMLDLSYNHMGPVCADCIPAAVMRHPRLVMLGLSGNSLGASKGASLIFALAAEPGGDKAIEEREIYYKEVKEKKLKGIDVAAEEAAKAQEEAEKALKEGKGVKTKKSKKKKDTEEKVVLSKLAVITLADNQLGRMSGFAGAALVVNSKSLTSLDLSGNNLGYSGGEAFADGLEKAYSLIPRDFFKKALYEIEEQKFEGRNAKVRKAIYTNLTALNLSQNGLGPTACQGLMYSIGSANCSITSLDLSNNPLGYSIENGGNATLAGVDMREALQNSQSMTHLDISRSEFLSTEMVPIMGSLAKNTRLKRLQITDILLDEPSCLQLAHGISSCPSITVVDFHNTRMGPKGGLMIVNRLDELGNRLTFMDLSGNGIGPVSCIPIGVALERDDCAIRTLHLSGNDMMDEGGKYVIKGMKANASLTDVDLSDNNLTFEVAELLADVARGLFKDGKKICDCQLYRLAVNHNPGIGKVGAKMLAKALISENFTHVEIANIGAGPGTAKIIGDAIRDVALRWVYCDVSGNQMSRVGMNEIFWGMRQNRSLRVLMVGDNQAGSMFASDADALLSHGIALQRTIFSNVMLRELDLSYNGLSSNAGVNIFEAMVENYTIRKLCLRGNFLDDGIREALSSMLQYNDVCDDLDLGENQLGFDCCFAVGESLSMNRALNTLYLDNNNLNAAGISTLKTFMYGLMMNTSLRVLVMDGNKLGSEWGQQLADALARNNTLVQVSFKDNRLDERAGEELLKAYTNAPFLMELALSADEVGTANWDKFTKEFNKKRSIVDREEVNQETNVNEQNTVIMKQYYPQKDNSIR